ncbi:hypothetical protein GGI11_009173, partial [Coemansia sp. RSA 2049]
ACCDRPHGCACRRRRHAGPAAGPGPVHAHLGVAERTTRRALQRQRRRRQQPRAGGVDRLPALVLGVRAHAGRGAARRCVVRQRRSRRQLRRRGGAGGPVRRHALVCARGAGASGAGAGRRAHVQRRSARVPQQGRRRCAQRVPDRIDGAGSAAVRCARQHPRALVARRRDRPQHPRRDAAGRRCLRGGRRRRAAGGGAAGAAARGVGGARISGRVQRRPHSRHVPQPARHQLPGVAGCRDPGDADAVPEPAAGGVDIAAAAPQQACAGAARVPVPERARRRRLRALGVRQDPRLRARRRRAVQCAARAARLDQRYRRRPGAACSVVRRHCRRGRPLRIQAPRRAAAAARAARSKP